MRTNPKSDRLQPYKSQYMRLCKLFVDAMKDHQRSKASGCRGDCAGDDGAATAVWCRSATPQATLLLAGQRPRRPARFLRRCRSK
jgi:hypothetical protein